MLDTFRRLLSDRRGNVSILFGLSLLPMLGAAGAAVDYSRSSSAKSSLTAAADAAALAGAGITGTATEREAAARQVFVNNLRSTGFPFPVTVSYQNIVEGGRSVGFRVDTGSSVPMLFAAFVGKSNVDVSHTSQARSGLDEAVELAFVLDTTDSMEGDRIVNLKAASNAMLDGLQSRAMARPDLLKVGVVPFAQYVNVGMGYRNAPWIDVPADYQTPVTTTCGPVYDITGWTNCRMVSYPAEPFVPPGTCMRDGRPRTCGGSPGRPARTENVCDPVYSTTPRTQCYNSGGDWVRWDGCVGSRTYPLNIQDGSYGTRIPGIMGVSCASPIRELTTDVSSVRASINGLVTMGETYLPAGLIWGKRLLSPGEPFASSATPGTRKIMVLVTDGQNTKSPTYPAHDGSDNVMADRLTREVCQNIAADRSNPVRIFTVAFEVSNPDVKDILRNCSLSTGGQFFDAMDASLLRASFADIVNQIYTVRLTQ